MRNKRPYEVEIPEVGFVAGGGTIEVPDALGKSLAKQVDAWAEVKSTSKKEN